MERKEFIKNTPAQGKRKYLKQKIKIPETSFCL
jgi:hypothetical protein